MDPGGAMANWTIPPGRSEKGSDFTFVCKWSGVSCHPRTRAITKLELTNPDYNQCLFPRKTGNTLGTFQSIPPAFSTLTALEVLNLQYNGRRGTDDRGSAQFGGLQGSLPSELGMCTALSFISLRYNQFSGTIPLGLSSLSRLQSLDLSRNGFSGSIPDFIGRLSGLTLLSLDYNNITGSIPFSLTGLASLPSLSLSFLPLSGTVPSELGALQNLTSLTLSHLPSLTGTIPESLSRLKVLAQLTVSNTGVQGSFPTWTLDMPSLTELRLSNNNLQGPLPRRSWGKTLQKLALDSNSFSGPIPADAMCATEGNQSAALTSLNLTSNGFTGGIPLSLSSCSNLGTLSLSRNPLSGLFPSEQFLKIFQPTLSYLDLSYANLQGSIPNVFVDFNYIPQVYLQSNELGGRVPQIPCNVDTFNFSGNSLQGTLREALGLLLPPSSCSMMLNRLDLSHNNLTGSIPKELSSVGFTELHLQNNNIIGSLPGPIPGLPYFVALTHLDLAYNKLQGPIPPPLLRRVQDLASLDLSYNRLNGVIPSLQDSSRQLDPTSSTQALLSLQLQGNLLSGSIPPSLSQLLNLTLLNLSHNQLADSVPTALASIPYLAALDLAGNKLSGSVPASFALAKFLGTLNLSGNNLSGPIPGDFAPVFLTWLSYLDLSYNRLTGDIPYAMAVDQSRNASLRFAFNNLTGQVPASPSGVFPFTPEDLKGNPLLCGGGTSLTPWAPSCIPPSAPTTSSLTPGVVAGIVVAGVVILGAIGLVLWWVTRPRDEWNNGALMVFQPTESPLTARSLVESTGFFSEDCALGKGGFGWVYRGELPDGTPVAIKRLAAGSQQGDSEFKAELQYLGGLSHRNLVRLIAAYVGAAPSHERLLVYEFMPGGALDSILTNIPVGSPYRSLDVRIGIGLDVARALRYLHHEANPPVIHRDMKPANVLMDSELVAHVADFGLAKEAELGVTHLTTEIFGTVGYLAPEYSTFGHCSARSDVYAYGVTVIQLMTGRRPSDEEIAERGLQRWVKRQGLEGALDPTIDMNDKDDIRRARAFLKIGLQCISRIPVDRPSMDEVVHYLENLDDIAAGIIDADPQL